MFYPHIDAPYRNRKWLALSGWWCLLACLLAGSNRTAGEGLCGAILPAIGLHFCMRVSRSPVRERLSMPRLFGTVFCVGLGLHVLLQRQPLRIGAPPRQLSPEELERAMSQRPWMGAL